MTPNSDRDRPGVPTIAEIAALTRRLRALSTPGHDADPAERAAFLADKDALIARITDTANAAADGRAKDRSRAGFAATGALREALTDAVLARAAGDGYVLVGPSSRTWRRDPDTGRPTVEVPDAEHQAVRDLLGRYALDTTQPEWVLGPDGHDGIHSTVHIADPDTIDDTDGEEDDGWWARAQPAAGDGPVVIFDRSDYYSDTEIADIADAIERGDTEHAARLQDHDDTGAATEARSVMPDEMREQADAPDAADARPDNPAELAARVAALRQQITANPAAGTTAPHSESVAAEDEDTRWYTANNADRDAAGEGLHVLDDGPGLP